jgi:hypothetical protein
LLSSVCEPNGRDLEVWRIQRSAGYMTGGDSVGAEGCSRGLLCIARWTGRGRGWLLGIDLVNYV